MIWCLGFGICLGFGAWDFFGRRWQMDVEKWGMTTPIRRKGSPGRSAVRGYIFSHMVRVAARASLGIRCAPGISIRIRKEQQRGKPRCGFGSTPPADTKVFCGDQAFYKSAKRFYSAMLGASLFELPSSLRSNYAGQDDPTRRRGTMGFPRGY